MRPRPDRRAPGELESAVLAVPWSAGEQRTPSEVQREPGEVLAYSTVATILSRPHTKGVVGRTKRRRSYVYTPVSDEPGVAARRMHQVLNARPDRDTVLARFVSDLSPADELLLPAHLTGRHHLFLAATALQPPPTTCTSCSRSPAPPDADHRRRPQVQEHSCHVSNGDQRDGKGDQRGER